VNRPFLQPSPGWARGSPACVAARNARCGLGAPGARCVRARCRAWAVQHGAHIAISGGGDSSAELPKPALRGTTLSEPAGAGARRASPADAGPVHTLHRIARAFGCFPGKMAATRQTTADEAETAPIRPKRAASRGGLPNLRFVPLGRTCRGSAREHGADGAASTVRSVPDFCGRNATLARPGTTAGFPPRGEARAVN